MTKRVDKEWEVEATIEIKTSFFCDTREEAEEVAHKYLSEKVGESVATVIEWLVEENLDDLVKEQTNDRT